MPIASLDPVRRSTVVDQLTESLIDAVIDGRFAVGAALPPERDLAEALEVNRATLRQAVARLEQIGLLRRRQGSGTVVLDPRQLTAPEVVARLAAAEQLAFLDDLLEVREALAGVIGRRATGSLGHEQVARLRSTIDQIQSAPASRDRQLLELGFFAVLVDAAGNRAIEVLLRWLGQVYENLTVPAVERAFDDAGPVVEDLRRLLEVIESGGDLESAMTAYARTTGARLRAAAG